MSSFNHPIFQNNGNNNEILIRIFLSLTRPTKWFWSWGCSSCIYLFTNLTVWEGWDTRSIFKWSLTVLNSEFSFSYTGCLTKTKEPSMLNYQPIGEGRLIRFIPFPRVLCERQSASSRIWTCSLYLFPTMMTITPQAIHEPCHGKNSLSEFIHLQVFNWFELRVFLLLDWLLYPD